MNKKIIFVVCTEYGYEEFKSRSATQKFFSDNELVVGIDCAVFYNNKLGLGSVYNSFFTEKYKDNIVVFLHDDIQVGYNMKTITRELNNAHGVYDIVGLAGADTLRLTTPALWHHMMSPGTGSGSVGHYYKKQHFMTCFGPCKQCMVIDGLFISVNVEKIIESKHKFDEQFKFHHYDIDFCIQANKHKLTIGTWPIWVTHLSPGLSSLDNPTWKESNNLFCKKYNIT